MQKQLCRLSGFDGEETKSKGFFEHEIQVDGVKLTDYIHVVSDLECDILLCVNELSGCDLPVTT